MHGHGLSWLYFKQGELYDGSSHVISLNTLFVCVCDVDEDQVTFYFTRTGETTTAAAKRHSISLNHVSIAPRCPFVPLDIQLVLHHPRRHRSIPPLSGLAVRQITFTCCTNASNKEARKLETRSRKTLESWSTDETKLAAPPSRCRREGTLDCFWIGLEMFSNTIDLDSVVEQSLLNTNTQRANQQTFAPNIQRAAFDHEITLDLLSELWSRWWSDKGLSGRCCRSMGNRRTRSGVREHVCKWRLAAFFSRGFMNIWPGSWQRSAIVASLRPCLRPADNVWRGLSSHLWQQTRRFLKPRGTRKQQVGVLA